MRPGFTHTHTPARARASTHTHTHTLFQIAYGCLAILVPSHPRSRFVITVAGRRCGSGAFHQLRTTTSMPWVSQHFPHFASALPKYPKTEEERGLKPRASFPALSSELFRLNP